MRDLEAIAALNHQLAVRRRWRAFLQWLRALRPRGVRGWEYGDMT
jgi:hypothetical protein